MKNRLSFEQTLDLAELGKTQWDIGRMNLGPYELSPAFVACIPNPYSTEDVHPDLARSSLSVRVVYKGYEEKYIIQVVNFKDTNANGRFKGDRVAEYHVPTGTPDGDKLAEIYQHARKEATGDITPNLDRTIEALVGLNGSTDKLLALVREKTQVIGFGDPDEITLAEFDEHLRSFAPGGKNERATKAAFEVV